MKSKTTLIAALCCAFVSGASAFSLDFVGYEGVTLPPNPLVIPVPGYGNVTFQAGSTSSLVVDNSFINSNGFGAPSLTFSQGDTVRVTFSGAPLVGVDFDFVGVSIGENFVVQEDQFNPQSYLLTLQGQGNGAGLYQVSFDQVPEPTTSLLGAMGAALLVIRRRR